MSNEIVASWWTLAGSAPEPPPVYAPRSQRSLRDRIVAAARAGFAGIGLRQDDYGLWLEQGGTPRELRDILRSHDIRIDEAEFISGWDSQDSGVRKGGLAVEQALFALADEIGFRQVNVGSPDPVDVAPTFEAQVEGFAGVCDRAARHGLAVALEFMPWSTIPTPAAGWRILEAAGKSNAGLLVDSWHLFRNVPEAVAQLEAIPPERIFGIQIDDADLTIQGDILYDSLHHRRLPGEGSFDLISFVRLLDARGVDAPFAVEVISDEQARMPLADAARSTYAATRAVIDAARSL